MTFYPLRRIIIPVILLITAALLRDAVNGLNPAYRHLSGWLPYLMLGIALAFCAYYNRARLFTAALAMLLVYYLVQTELQVALTVARPLLIYSMISIALPVTCLFLYLIPDRGLRNRYGLLVVAIVPLFWLIGLCLLNYYPAIDALVFVLTYMPIKPFPGYVLSLTASTVFIVTIGIGLFRLYRRDVEYFAALVAVLLFSFITLVLFDRPGISVVMFTAAGVGLIISLVNSSYEMAYRDDLTGLLGRRALNERLKGLGRRYVIAMLDVDHFKKFNDTYGHDVGDDVLKMVARQIAAVRGGGTAYRYGGEEFCIVFAGKDIEQCEPVLEEVRLAIQKYQMQLRDTRHRSRTDQSALERRGRRTKDRNARTVSVTISVGMAEWDTQQSKPDQVLKAADSALYRAKKRGRNCVVW